MGLFAAAVVTVVLIAIVVTWLSNNPRAHFGGIALAVSLSGMVLLGYVLHADIENTAAVMLIALLIAVRWRSPEGVVIAGLYVVRVFWLILEYNATLPAGWFMGLDNRVVYWDINNAVVLVQAMVAIRGGMVNGGFSIRRPMANYALARLRFRRDLCLAAWLPIHHGRYPGGSHKHH